VASNKSSSKLFFIPKPTPFYYHLDQKNKFLSFTQASPQNKIKKGLPKFILDAGTS